MLLLISHLSPEVGGCTEDNQAMKKSVTSAAKSTGDFQSVVSGYKFSDRPTF